MRTAAKGRDAQPREAYTEEVFGGVGERMVDNTCEVAVGTGADGRPWLYRFSEYDGLERHPEPAFENAKCVVRGTGHGLVNPDTCMATENNDDPEFVNPFAPGASRLVGSMRKEVVQGVERCVVSFNHPVDAAAGAAAAASGGDDEGPVEAVNGGPEDYKALDSKAKYAAARRVLSEEILTITRENDKLRKIMSSYKDDLARAEREAAQERKLREDAETQRAAASTRLATAMQGVHKQNVFLKVNDMCLMLKQTTPGSSGLLVKATCDAGDPFMRWTHDAQGRLVNPSSGLCADFLEPRGPLKHLAKGRTTVVASPCKDDKPSQMWQERGDGLESQERAGQCMDTSVMTSLASCTDAPPQRLQFVPVRSGMSSLRNTIPR